MVPAERTKLAVHITDSSVKAHAPTHPGALVFYVGDLTLNTDIVGDAPSSLFHVLVPDLSILLLDDLESKIDGPTADKVPTSVNQGVAYWKVRPRVYHWFGSEYSPSLGDLPCSRSCKAWTCVAVLVTRNKIPRYVEWRAPGR